MRRFARAAARVWAREVVSGLVLPLLLVAALGLVQQAGLFAALDARFFDLVTTGERPAAPQVVVVEHDAGFRSAAQVQGAEAHARLEAALTARGAEAIGYLAPRPTGLPQVSVPLVVGRVPQAVPANEAWALPGEGEERNAGATRAARSMALAQYGIHRSQLAALPGTHGPIAVFETALAASRDASLRPAGEFLVRMPRRQNIPQIGASQIIDGELARSELDGKIAIVADASALRPGIATPLTPDDRSMSEARFRAHALQTLLSRRAAYPAASWQAWWLLAIVALVLVLAYRRIDPKRLAVGLPTALSVLVVVGSWAALALGGKLLPVTALALAPWLVTFQRVLGRELRQDRRLEESASRAIEHSFRRSALREGARLPRFLGFAAQMAGVERSLLIERQADGAIDEVVARNASIADIAAGRRELAGALGRMRGVQGSRDAGALVPGWGGQARIAWLSGAGSDFYWLYTEPESHAPAKSAQLVRAIAASFRQLLRWRADLNARAHQDERFVPVDDKVASAIALVARESGQIRHGFDTIDTAVMIFHLIGSPLHANAQMREIYREAGLAVAETSLLEALVALTDLDEVRAAAMLQDLVLNGGEMRMPMKQIGAQERVLRLAVPARIAHGSERVLVLEAVGIAHLNRAADLRQAVARFIDLQLRNDFEAILLGADLGANARIGPEQLRMIVARIGETARRGTARLDEVAELVRAENSEILDACYPVDARAIAEEAMANAQPLASELGVTIDARLPGLSGFTMAEPRTLAAMIEAMLRVVIGDTPQGDTVTLRLEEGEQRTHIRVSGGFGMGFGRLMWLLDNHETEAVGEYRVIGEGMAKAVGWDASVSYWGREADGFGFNVDLRRIG